MAERKTDPAEGLRDSPEGGPGGLPVPDPWAEPAEGALPMLGLEDFYDLLMEQQEQM